MRKILATIVGILILFSLNSQGLGKLMQDSLRYESDLWKKDRISYYLKTKDIHPEDYNALLNRGMENLRNELYVEAVANFKASLDANLVPKKSVPSVSKNKHKSESYFYIGICFELLEKADSAQFYLQKAIEINPYYDDAYIEHASIDLRNGRTEAALNTLINAYERNNKSRKLLSNLAALYIENGRFQKAKRLLKTAEKVTPGYSDPYISLAIIYLMESRITTAAIYLEKALKIDSTSAKAYYLLGMYHYYGEEYEEAYAALSKMYEIDSTNSQANYILGMLQIRYHNYDEGFSKLYNSLNFRLENLFVLEEVDFIFLELMDIFKTIAEGNINTKELEIIHNFFNTELTGNYRLRDANWERYVKLYPGSVTRLRMMVVDEYLRCLNIGNYICDLQELKRVLKITLIIDSSLVNLRFVDGYLDFKAGEFNEGIEKFDRVIEIWPEYKLSYYFKAACQFEKELYSEAITTLDTVLEHYPFYIDAERLRADIYLNHFNSYRSAIPGYKKCWAQQPFEDEAVIGIAKSYSNLQMPDSAIYFFSIALEIDEFSLDAAYHRGLEYYSLGYYDTAITDFSICIDHSYEYLKSLVYRGFCYNQLGEADKSIKDLNAVLEYDKTNGSIYYNIGELYFEQIKYNKAMKYFDDGITMAPDYVWNYYGKAKCMSAGGDYKSGIMYCLQATQKDPEFAMAYHEAGDNYYRLGNYRQSYFFYKKAAELDNTMYCSMFNTGLCMVRMGRIEEAMKLYEAYAAIPGIDSHIHCKEAILKLQNLYHQDIFKQDISNILTEVFDIEP